jgi:hypothetical protein
MHHWYSSSVSPFQAKTGTPVAAMAAAAWSWVEKMLHDDQVTWAPRAVRVSMRTALQKSGQIERWVSPRYLRSRGQAERQKSSRTFGWLIGAGADRDESQLDELCCALPRRHSWLQRRTHVEAAGDAGTLEGLRLGELESDGSEDDRGGQLGRAFLICPSTAGATERATGAGVCARKECSRTFSRR